ncbi:MAG: rhomboid family intramembrane serine protease [Paracoccaceae bacterium]
MDHNTSPLNALPAAVWLLALPMIAVELVVSLGAAGIVGGPEGIGWRLQALQTLAFSPELLRYDISIGRYSIENMLRLVTYPFVHGDLTSAIFGIVMLLALGKVVGEVFRWWALIAVFLGSAVLAALIYAAIPPMTTALVGAFPAVYGLVGAFTFLMWVRLAAVGANQFRAFSLIGLLLLTQFLFGVLFGGGTLWVAEIAGFAAGFLLSFLVSPGGWERVKARLRER